MPCICNDAANLETNISEKYIEKPAGFITILKHLF